MNKSAYYLISDIHLERKNEYKKQFLLDSINKKIEDNKSLDIKTIIVFSGDVDNGTKAYEWMSKINAEIVYVAGNHEFWNKDYYETLEDLKKSPSHVHFLNNDFIEVGDYIFVGATMWTDVGKTLNPSLIHLSNGVMNDNYNITAKYWYNNPKNVKDLKKVVNEYNLDSYIEKAKWNVLIEQEENEKTLKFFNDFSKVHHHLKKFKEVYDNADKELKNKYFPLTKEKYEAIKKASDLKKYSYRQWLYICNQYKILGYDEISEEEIENITGEHEKIFKKLSLMNLSKEIIMVSHHLPFLEERLVGYYSHIQDNHKLYNEKADNKIYAIRDGLDDYPYHNYFYRIGKGEFSRDESILEAIHYSNNGTINLPTNFLNIVKTWCHGHDHQLNYQDYVKGTPIVTNPLSYSLDVFSFSENGVHLNDSYKQYHQIDSDDKEQAEIDELKSVVLKEIKINKNGNDDDVLKLWIFSMMDFEKIKFLLTNVTIGCKKLFTYLAKNPQFSLEEITDKQQQKIMDMFFSNHYYYQKLKEDLNKLDLAYSMRMDANFSYANRFNGLYSKEITQYFLTDSNDFSMDFDLTEKMTEFQYSYITDSLFKNLYYLNKSMKKIKHFESIIDCLKDKKSVTDFFDTELPELYPKESKKIEYLFPSQLSQKKNKLLDKYMTPEIKEKLAKKMKERFNF